MVFEALESARAGNWTLYVNDTVLQHRSTIFSDIEWNVDFAMLLLSLVVAILWITFVTYYNSRLFGLLFRTVANRMYFIRMHSHLHVGSFSFSLLSGKIMFRDVVYFTDDYTVRIMDGALIFRYWLRCTPRRLGVDDFSKGDTRLRILLNGVEMHVFNCLEKYSRLFDLCGIDTSGEEWKQIVREEKTFGHAGYAASFFDLCPVVSLQVSSARIAFGNNYLPSTLLVTFDDGYAFYSVRPPSSSFDDYLHTVQGRCENFKIAVVRSIDYTGPFEAPPRTMGNGFVVLQTSELSFIHRQDEPGTIAAAVGKQRPTDPFPMCESEVRLGSGTVISYGPWADAQREKLYTFFYPNDYQTLPITPLAASGQRRLFGSYKMKVDIAQGASLDILFMRDDIPNAIHFVFNKGSSIDVTIPFVVLRDTGYQVLVNCQLIAVEASTSMEYRQLFRSDVVGISLEINFGRAWSDTQQWLLRCDCQGSTLWWIFSHKYFFQDLIAEWSSPHPPDFNKFVPYTWVFFLTSKDLEVLLPTNQYNWIDTSSQNEENILTAVCIKEAEVDYLLPFTDFDPPSVTYTYSMRGTSLAAKMHFPEHCLMNMLSKVIYQNSRIDGRVFDDLKFDHSMFRRGETRIDDHWFDIAAASDASVSGSYVAYQTPAWYESECFHPLKVPLDKFDASELAPDVIDIRVEVSPCCVVFSSPLVSVICNLQSNYFGRFQKATDISSYGNEVLPTSAKTLSQFRFDYRKYRPLNSRVVLVARQLKALGLTTFIEPQPLPAENPYFVADQLCFELCERWTELKLQLLLSPIVVHVLDRREERRHLPAVLDGGTVVVSAIQLRCHSFFSDVGLPPDRGNVEYAFLRELLVGNIYGSVTVDQMLKVIQFADLFMYTLQSSEEQMNFPECLKTCQHNQLRTLCREVSTVSSVSGEYCPAASKMCYDMIRCSLDGVSLCVLDGDVLLQMEVGCARCAFCTEHFPSGKAGLNVILGDLSAKSYLRVTTGEFSRSTSASVSTDIDVSRYDPTQPLVPYLDSDVWLEIARVCSGGIDAVLELSLNDADLKQRHDFLRLHDKRSRRLSFLYVEEESDYLCGCVGGCAFFCSIPDDAYFSEKYAHVVNWLTTGSQGLAIWTQEVSDDVPCFGQSIFEARQCFDELDLTRETENHKMETPVSAFQGGATSGSRTASVDTSSVNDEEFFDTEGGNEGEELGRSFSIGSFHTTTSREDEEYVDLSLQMNCSIFESRFLMTSYLKLLSQYRYRGLNSTTSLSTKLLRGLPRMEQLCRGVNDIRFWYRSEVDKSKPPKESSTTCLEMPSNDASVLERNRFDLSVKSDLVVFCCPLALDSLECILRSCSQQRISTLLNPSVVLLNLFRRCSSAGHRQLLVAKEKDYQLDSDSSSSFFSSLSFDACFTLPQTVVFFLQCSVADEKVPSAQLKHSLTLAPASYLLLLLQDQRTQLKCEELAPDSCSSHVLSCNAQMKSAVFQLTQIVDKGSQLMGLPTAASKVNVSSDWGELPFYNDFVPCLAFEGLLKYLAFSQTRFFHHRGQSPSVTSVATTILHAEPGKIMKAAATTAAETATTASPSVVSVSGARTPLFLQCESKRYDICPRSTCQNKVEVSVYSLRIDCGLWQSPMIPVETWPLYDVLEPSSSAWLHAYHRLNMAVNEGCRAFTLMNKMTLVCLLTEALDTPNVHHTAHKSKYDPVRIRQRLLVQCPSCQLMLALLHYCTSDVEEIVRKRSRRTDVFENEHLLNEVLIALLSHWRELLSAENFVQLNDAVAQRFTATRHAPSEDNDDQEATGVDINVIVDGNSVLGMESSNDEEETTLDAEQKSLLASDGPSWHLKVTRSAVTFRRRESGAHKNRNEPGERVRPRQISVSPSEGTSTLQTVVKPCTRTLSSRSRSRSAAIELTRDLYRWMAKEQEAERADGLLKQSVSADHVNPIDVPLDVYFEFFLRSQGLLWEDRRWPFVVLGSRFNLNLAFGTVVAVIVEPKLLQLSGGGMRTAVTHTEKPFWCLEELACKSFWRSDRQVKKGEEATTVFESKVDVDYNAVFKNCLFSFGFSTLSVLNQLTFVVKELAEIHSTLAMELPVARDFTDAELAEHCRRSMNDHKFPSSAASLASSHSPDRSRMGQPSESFSWSLRARTILRDFQKARKFFLKNCDLLKFTGSGKHLMRVFICSGTSKAAHLEMRALFTELMVGVDFKSFEVKHVTEERSIRNKNVPYLQVSFTCSVRRVNLNLSDAESNLTSFRTVCQIAVEQSSATFMHEGKSAQRRRRNSILLHVGPVSLDIPLHPGTLHGVVIRGTRKITERMPTLLTPSMVEDTVPKRKAPPTESEAVGLPRRQLGRTSPVLVVEFDICFQSLNVTAALLPSLKAIYQMGEARSHGVTGSETNFIIRVPIHKITFDVKELAAEASCVAPFIQISCPMVYAQGNYVQYHQEQAAVEKDRDRPGTSGNLIVKEGAYLKIDIAIGKIQHTLTTDLLNQLLFIQEAFLAELGEIIMKITSERLPTTLTVLPRSHTPLLYSLEFAVESVEITASTPTATAVRLGTDDLKLHFSNRLFHKGFDASCDRVNCVADISLTVALGQLIKRALFGEVVPEFKQFAFFKTGIVLKNVVAGDQQEGATGTGDDSVVTDSNGNQSTYLMNLRRPVIFMLPRAFDKAVLLWLNYKNTYEFWNEQRTRIRAQVGGDTSDRKRRSQDINVFDQLHNIKIDSSAFRFVQIQLDGGLHVCLPLYHTGTVGLRSPEGSDAALIVALRSTQITVCSRGPFVSRGYFRGFSVFFVADFDAVAETWKPEVIDSMTLNELNSCFVTEGTYSLCSKTFALKDDASAGLWVLNLDWHMNGLDLNMNTQIVHMCSLLVSTLTSLAGETGEAMQSAAPEQQSVRRTEPNDTGAEMDLIKGVIEQSDATALSSKQRTKLIERQMNEQSKMVSDLIQMAASEATIEIERRKLEKLEAALFNEFRREIVQKLRKPSHRAFSVQEHIKPLHPRKSISQKLTHPTALGLRITSEALETAKEFSSSRTPHGDRAKLVSPTEPLFSSNQTNFPFDSPDTPKPFNLPKDEQQPRITFDDYDSGNAHSRLDSDHEDIDDVQSARPSRGGLFVQVDKAAVTAPPKQQAVDLKLDIRISVESGRCMFRTPSAMKEVESMVSLRKARFKEATTAKRVKSSHHLRPPSQDASVTIALLPALSIKAYYASRSTSGIPDLVVSTENLAAVPSPKKGEFYLWFTLGSMPEETVLSPHLLDFMEMALNAFSRDAKAGDHLISESTTKPPTVQSDVDLEQFSIDMASAAVQSFPVDVYVYFNVQATSIRFVSQPYTMVECVLNLPQLNLTFTCKRTTGHSNKHLETQRSLGSDVLMLNHLPSFENGSEWSLGTSAVQNDLSIGSIIISLMLSDFSLFIYHPYGASTNSTVGRRDAFTIQVKAVCVNMTRNSELSQATTDRQKNGMDESATTTKNSAIIDANVVHFSLIIDISEANLKYDMRRLKEILSFPKAWYRRSIMRRLFFGATDKSSSSESTTETMQLISPKIEILPRTSSIRRRRSAGVHFTEDPRGSISGTVGAPDPRLKQQACSESLSLSELDVKQTDTGADESRWEAVVLVMVNVRNIFMEAMIGQAMGHTTWHIDGATVEGLIKASCLRDKTVCLSLSLDSSTLEAKGGVISGMLTLQSYESFGSFHIAPSETPKHLLGARIDAMDARVEWMSATIFIIRLTDLVATIRDEWKIGFDRSLDTEGEEESSSASQAETCLVMLVGSISFSKLQAVMMKTTVSDYVRIYNKLYEFVEQQFKNGRMILFLDQLSKGDVELSDGESNLTTATTAATTVATGARYRHWQKALELITRIQLQSPDFFPLPRNATILGSSLDFLGNEITLSCFYGSSFAASQQWALFYLRKAYTIFSTEAKDVIVDGKFGALVNQDLMFKLGSDGMVRSERPMAVILRVQRSQYWPTQLSSIEEWLQYACHAPLQQLLPDASPPVSAFRHYKHSISWLFKIPALRLDMKTSHLQLSTLAGKTRPEAGTESEAGTSFEAVPQVRCVFVTDFDDNVQVTHDLEALNFLRELITSYMAEKLSRSDGGAGGASGGDETKAKPVRFADPTEQLQNDCRQYIVTTWHLKPQIQWMETVINAERVLGLLGFKNPRETIPKWIQRGFMDTMDNFSAALMEKMFTFEMNK